MRKRFSWLFGAGLDDDRIQRAISAYLLQFWITTMAFLIDVGGRPLHSWPSYIPVTLEMTVLFASSGAFFGIWALNGLPMTFHPPFRVKRFAGVTRNRFLVRIESADPNFDMVSTRAFLMSLVPESIVCEFRPRK